MSCSTLATWCATLAWLRMAARDFSHGVAMSSRSHSSSRPVQLSVNVHPYGQGRMLLLSRDITAVGASRGHASGLCCQCRGMKPHASDGADGLRRNPAIPALVRRGAAGYLALMSQQAQRMQTLVSDLLTLSRLEGSPLPSEMEWVSMDTLMGQCEQEARGPVALAARSAAQTAFQLRHPVGTGRVAVGFAQRLVESHQQCCALYAYSAIPSKLGFERIPDGGARFVHDSGPGIAAEHLPRLTERFYRVDRSRSRDTEELDWGLQSSSMLLSVTVPSWVLPVHPARGSTFSLTFPSSRVRTLSSSLLDSERVFQRRLSSRTDSPALAGCSISSGASQRWASRLIGI